MYQKSQDISEICWKILHVIIANNVDFMFTCFQVFKAKFGLVGSLARENKACHEYILDAIFGNCGGPT